MVTPSFPDITRAWYHEIIETKNCIAALSFPGNLGNLPELMCVRADTDLGDAFTAQVVRSRDYVSISKSLVEPGVNLEAGDTVQMPLDFGDALQAMLQQTDMNTGSFLADPDELGF